MDRGQHGRGGGTRSGDSRRDMLSPTSRFHHAGSSSGGGFCTFNGLMVAALSLYADDLVDRVAIIDYDYHPGNGTDDIIFRRGCEDWCLHVDTAWSDRSTDFLAEMERSLARVAAFQPHLVLYQAGADMWVDDPLGGLLTIDELLVRDRAVFEMCHRHSLPIAWNLAGGYAREPDGSIPKVLEIHRGTAENCIKIFGSP